MNETLVTLVGNAATGVEFRETASGGMARFRFAVTPRRWDREKQLWTDGHTSFYTVWAWRTLAANLSGSVAVGEPLVVHGRLKVREEEREGQRRTFVDIEATAVGHDLTRGTSAFRRAVRTEPERRAVTRGGGTETDPWAVRERPGGEPVGGERQQDGEQDGVEVRAAENDRSADRLPPGPRGRGEGAGEHDERPVTRRRTGRQKKERELVAAS